MATVLMCRVHILLVLLMHSKDRINTKYDIQKQSYWIVVIDVSCFGILVADPVLHNVLGHIGINLLVSAWLCLHGLLYRKFQKLFLNSSFKTFDFIRILLIVTKKKKKENLEIQTKKLMHNKVMHRWTVDGMKFRLRMTCFRKNICGSYKRLSNVRNKLWWRCLWLFQYSDFNV